MFVPIVGIFLEFFLLLILKKYSVKWALEKKCTKMDGPIPSTANARTYPLEFFQVFLLDIVVVLCFLSQADVDTSILAPHLQSIESQQSK